LLSSDDNKSSIASIERSSNVRASYCMRETAGGVPWYSGGGINVAGALPGGGYRSLSIN
jgi:hypothetical protein